MKKNNETQPSHTHKFYLSRLDTEDLGIKETGKIVPLDGGVIINGNYWDHRTHYRKLFKAEEFETAIREKSIEPDERLKHFFDLARDYLAFLQRMVGIPETDKSKLEVCLVDEDQAIRVFEDIYNIELRDFKGLHLKFVDPVVVVNDSLLTKPHFAATALHEWIHHCIDAPVTRFSPQKTVEGVSMNYFDYRVGLFSIMNSKRFRKQRSLFLNELGNQVWQWYFYLHVHEKSPDSIPYVQQMREYLIKKKYHCTDDTLIQTHRDISIKCNISNFSILADGTLDLDLDGLAAQLVDDLTIACGLGEGELARLLLKAKVEPKIQNQIRKILDRVFERGFYAKLRKAKPSLDTYFEIISEVQSKVKD